MNLISVIIPAYNCDRTISKCLDSLLSQTYPNFEIIVIDDGSKDKTNDVVSNYSKKDGRVRLIYQNNSGVSEARNHGIECAIGEFITFVDSDDYVSDKYLEEMIILYDSGIFPVVNFANNDSESCVLNICSDYYEYSIDDNYLSDYLAGDLGKMISFSVWNKLFVKRIITENNIKFTKELKIGEDMIFVLQYLNFCSMVKILNKPMYHYCFNQTSTINSDKSNFAPLYEATFNTLLSICNEREKTVLPALAYWSLSVTKYTVSNNYVTSKKYHSFCNYFNYLKDLSFIKCAKSCNQLESKRDRLLKFALSQNRPFYLFSVVKINRLVQNLKRGM